VKSPTVVARRACDVAWPRPVAETNSGACECGNVVGLTYVGPQSWTVVSPLGIVYTGEYIVHPESLQNRHLYPFRSPVHSFRSPKQHDNAHN